MNGDSIYIKDEDGTERWTVNDNLHRVDGPAYISYQGGYHKEWYLHGQLHRKNGPAIISSSMSGSHLSYYEHWYEFNELHRINGPAMIYTTSTNGTTYSWALYNEEYNFNEWFDLNPISDEEKLMIKLKYA